MVQKIAVTLEQ